MRKLFGHVARFSLLAIATSGTEVIAETGSVLEDLMAENCVVHDSVQVELLLGVYNTLAPHFEGSIKTQLYGADDEIDLVLVDTDYLGENSSVANILALARDNFVFVGPRTILVDSRYLTFLFYIGEIVFSYFVNANSVISTDDPTPVNYLTAFETIEAVRDYSMLRNTNAYYDDRDAWASEAHAHGWLPIELPVGSSFVLFPLAHELSHLRLGHHIGNKGPSLRLEREADSMAVVVLNRIKEKRLISCMIDRFAEFMCMQVLIDAFDYFCGLSAEDYLICMEISPVGGLFYSITDSGKRLNEIGYAHWNPPPGLLPDEYDDLAKRISRHGFMGGNLHLIERATKIARSYGRNSSADFHGYDSFLEHIRLRGVEGALKSLHANSRSRPRSIGVLSKVVIEQLREIFPLVEGLNSDYRECWVGEKNDIRLEIFADEDTIVEARILRHHNYTQGDTLHQASMRTFVSLIGTIAGPCFGMENIVKELLSGSWYKYPFDQDGQPVPLPPKRFHNHCNSVSLKTVNSTGIQRFEIFGAREFPLWPAELRHDYSKISEARKMFQYR